VFDFDSFIHYAATGSIAGACRSYAMNKMTKHCKGRSMTTPVNNQIDPPTKKELEVLIKR
jgi:hypothetical protein